MNRESDILDELDRSGNLRKLRTTRTTGAYIESEGERYVNLSSNDYLGISSSSFQSDFFDNLDPAQFTMSNPSSRLMTGNSPEYEELESTIADLYKAESALVLGSGFLLNSGILSAVTTDKDLVIADKLMHASFIDGMRLCPARHERFRHNDMNHLESILRKTTAEKTIVATESLFSMDGDIAPLNDIAQLQQKYGFGLYLDEAHALGVWGSGGRGLSTTVPQLTVDYMVATLGKAICSQGAFVACSSTKRELMVNRARTLIYSTALPPISLRWTKYVIDRLADLEPQRKHLQNLIKLMNGESQIIPYIIGDNHLTLQKAAELRKAGYWVSAIRQPSVAAGTERLRFSLTAAHTQQQITDLCKLLG